MVKRALRIRYPRNLEKWYAKELRKMIFKWRRHVMYIFNHDIKSDLSGGANFLKDAAPSDDETWLDNLKRALELMEYTINDARSDNEIYELASRYVKAINQFSYNNVKVSTAIVGLDPISNNAQLNSYVKAKIDENVNLIISLRNGYSSSISKDIYRGVTTGMGVTAIAKDIAKRTGMSVSHGLLIANDQTGSIISQLDAYRATHSGATKYIWHSMEDNRVRIKHQELDGKVFKYNDPHGGDNGQLPGEPIRCRCYAEPID